MTDREKLTQENILLLQEGLSLLATISDEEYLVQTEDAGSAAEHFRHIINHYEAFLSAGDKIDYETRDRGHGAGRDRIFAITTLESIMQDLPAHNGESHIAVERIVNSPEGQLETILMPTSAERELDFLASHTTHHYAVLALMLHSRKISLPAGFGMSRSTLRHLAAEHS